MSDTGFAGRTAVVTGAGRGIGAAIAEGLAASGTDIVVADLDEEAAASTATRISNRGAGRATAQVLDVTSKADHESAIDTALARYGRLDHYVNNAGVFEESDFETTDAELVHRMFRVNVDGVLYGTQAAARHMRDHGGGSIVNIASLAGSRARPARTAYCSSKAAVLQVTHCAAIELAQFGVRVNAVSPGHIETELTRWLREDPALFDDLTARNPSRRMGRPAEVFGVVKFLLSADAAYVNGADIPVDGGSRHV